MNISIARAIHDANADLSQYQINLGVQIMDMYRMITLVLNLL